MTTGIQDFRQSVMSLVLRSMLRLPIRVPYTLRDMADDAVGHSFPVELWPQIIDLITDHGRESS